MHNSLCLPIPPLAWFSPAQVPIPSTCPAPYLLTTCSYISLTLIVLHQHPVSYLLGKMPFLICTSSKAPNSCQHTPSLPAAPSSAFYSLSRPFSWIAHHLPPAHHPPCTSPRPSAEDPPSSLLESSSPFHLSNESLETVPRPALCVRLKAHASPKLVTGHVALQRSAGAVCCTATELWVRHSWWQQRSGRGGAGMETSGSLPFLGMGDSLSGVLIPPDFLLVSPVPQTLFWAPQTMYSYVLLTSEDPCRACKSALLSVACYTTLYPRRCCPRYQSWSDTGTPKGSQIEGTLLTHFPFWDLW